jgi:hypothetical protein
MSQGFTKGPKGDTGATGPTGSSGSPAPFRHIQYFAPDFDSTSIVDTIGNAAPVEAGTKTTVNDSSGQYTNYATTTVLNNAAGLSVGSATKFQCGPIARSVIKSPASITNTRVWGLALARSDPATSDTMSTGGIGFRFSPTSAGDTKWQVFSSTEAGSGAATDSGVTVVADTRYEFMIDATDPTSIKCYINGSLVATITGNLPGTTNSYNAYVESACVTGGTATSVRWRVLTLEQK